MDKTNRFIGEVFLERNGIGNYTFTRNIRIEGQRATKQYPLATEDNEILRQQALVDMRREQAGGIYGADDDGQWYPISLLIAEKITWPEGDA